MDTLCGGSQLLVFLIVQTGHNAEYLSSSSSVKVFFPRKIKPLKRVRLYET